MTNSSHTKVTSTLASALCLVGLLATDAAAQSARPRFQPTQPHVAPGRSLPIQPVPSRGWLLNRTPGVSNPGLRTQPVPPRGWLLNQRPVSPDRRLTTQPVPQPGLLNPRPRRMHEGYTPAPNPRRGPNPVGSLLDWNQRSSIGPGGAAPNRFPAHSGNVGTGYNPNYPGYVPRGQGNVARPTGRQQPAVDPGYRPRQEATARERIRWAEDCVQQRRTNTTLDCNPPQQFESPRSAARPHGTSAYEDTFVRAK